MRSNEDTKSQDQLPSEELGLQLGFMWLSGNDFCMPPITRETIKGEEKTGKTKL